MSRSALASGLNSTGPISGSSSDRANQWTERRERMNSLRDQMHDLLRANGPMATPDLAKRMGITQSQIAVLVHAFPSYFQADKSAPIRKNVRIGGLVDLHPHLRRWA